MPKKKSNGLRQVLTRQVIYWWPILAAMALLAPFFIFQSLQMMVQDVLSGTGAFGRFSPAMTHGVALQRAKKVDDHAQRNVRGDLPVEFHIAAGDLSQSLGEFATQSGYQLLFEYPKVQGKRSRGVQGTMAPLVAMHGLVDGTGFMIAEVKPDVIAVVPTPTASGDAGGAGATGGVRKHPGRAGRTKVSSSGHKDHWD